MKTTFLPTKSDFRHVFVDGQSTLAEVQRVAWVIILPIVILVALYLVKHPGL